MTDQPAGLTRRQLLAKLFPFLKSDQPVGRVTSNEGEGLVGHGEWGTKAPKTLEEQDTVTIQTSPLTGRE